MGCIATKGNTVEAQKSAQIDNQIKRENAANVSVKLLLLGTGDSGKSTFARQLRILHQDGFGDVDYEKFVWILADNCLRSMQKLIQECKNSSEVTFTSEMDSNAQLVLSSEDLYPQVAEAISKLWTVESVKTFYKNHQNINLPSSAAYFFTHALRFAQKNYKPTDEDILHAKLKTSGIIETKFSVGNVNFTVVDVGGQRSERRKWLHSFDSVTAVLYLAALDEYDKTLEEDASVNRMEESLTLLGGTSTSTFLVNKPFLLFLNKSDIFREKIKQFPLQKTFPQIAADVGSDYDKSLAFVQEKYRSAFRGKSVQFFVTCAIDTKNCELIFNSVQESVVKASLENSGFL